MVRIIVGTHPIGYPSRPDRTMPPLDRRGSSNLEPMAKSRYVASAGRPLSADMLLR
jgi:hypothetical protein